MAVPFPETMYPKTIRDAFDWQVAACRGLGSPFTADILAALVTVLDHSTRTGRRILDWPRPPVVDALPLRIAGGLNALARSGADAELSALYATRDGDQPSILRRVLIQWDEWLYPWLDSAPQTNEVGRSGVLWPGMMEIVRRFGPKLELLELGASAGLNLQMDRFAYDLGGLACGDAASGVRLKPDWDGPSPTSAPVEIVARSGVDLGPLDVTDPAIVDRMIAYIWPDQAERLVRTSAAIAIAQTNPVQIERSDGADWIERKLTEQQPAGATRVIYHSIALQYFPEAGRNRVKAAMEAAGARATTERPLAWLSMEFASMDAKPELTLRCWPGGGTGELLATCHPHGAQVSWLG